MVGMSKRAIKALRTSLADHGLKAVLCILMFSLLLLGSLFWPSLPSAAADNGTYTISGTVTDADDEPIAGVMV